MGIEVQAKTWRLLPTDPQPAWDGYSTPKRVGDTLVAETIGFRDGV
jgi:hypothetical protein